jgi:hypothetical protein
MLLHNLGFTKLILTFLLVMQPCDSQVIHRLGNLKFLIPEALFQNCLAIPSSRNNKCFFFFILLSILLFLTISFSYTSLYFLDVRCELAGGMAQKNESPQGNSGRLCFCVVI